MPLCSILSFFTARVYHKIEELEITEQASSNRIILLNQKTTAIFSPL